MPNYLVVTTTSDTPDLWLFQNQELREVERCMRTFPYSHTLRCHVFALRPVPLGPSKAAPSKSVLLALESRLEPNNEVENYRHYFVNALDDLPVEQALNELQASVDHLERTRLRLEQKAVQTEKAT